MAPVVTSDDKREVYLPEGQRFDFWNDKRHELTVHAREGGFPEMIGKRCFRVVLVGENAGLGLDNERYDVRVDYDGSEIKIKL